MESGFTQRVSTGTTLGTGAALSAGGTKSGLSFIEDKLEDIKCEEEQNYLTTEDRANLYLEYFEDVIEFTQQKAQAGDKDAKTCLLALYRDFYIKALTFADLTPVKNEKLLEIAFTNATEVLEAAIETNKHSDDIYALAHLHKAFGKAHWHGNSQFPNTTMGSLRESSNKEISLLEQAAEHGHKEAKIEFLIAKAMGQDPQAVCELARMGILFNDGNSGKEYLMIASGKGNKEAKSLLDDMNSGSLKAIAWVDFHHTDTKIRWL